MWYRIIPFPRSSKTLYRPTDEAVRSSRQSPMRGSRCCAFAVQIPRVKIITIPLSFMPEIIHSDVDARTGIRDSAFTVVLRRLIPRLTFRTRPPPLVGKRAICGCGPVRFRVVGKQELD